MLLPTDATPGETPLHRAARICTSLDDFILKIKTLSQERKIEYALTENDAGKLPMDVINDHLTSDDRDSVFSQLLNYALIKPVKDIHEPIDLQALIEQYGAKPGSALFSNLSLACEIANETRAITKISTTHPQVNGTDIDIYSLGNQLATNRTDRKNQYDQIVLSEALFTQRENSVLKNSIIVDVLLPNTTRERLKACAIDLTTLDGVGNCEEMATFALNLGRKKNLDISQYDYYRGDHVLDVIGNGLCTDKDAVICDSWSGLVCLASEYKSKLVNFRKYDFNGKHYNLITKFNSNFDSLKQIFLPQYCNFFTHTFIFNDNIIDNLIYPIAKKKSSAEQFLFCKIIRDNLDKAFTENLISESEIRSWTEPDTTLKKYFGNDEGYLPLITSKYSKNHLLYKEKVIKALLNLVDPNQASVNHSTTLASAAYLGYLDIVDLLLKAGADPNIASTDDTTAMMHAASQGHEAVLDLLLKSGGDPNISSPTPLFFASQNGHLKCVDLLLAYPGIKFIPIQRSADAFIAFSKDYSSDIAKRMDNHILNRINSGESATAISITPTEIATIMGHDDIAIKLQQAEKKNSIPSSTQMRVSQLPNHFLSFTQATISTPSVTLPSQALKR